MRAVGLYQHLPIDKPESLIDLDLPEPEPTGRDLLIRVDAVSVNPVDTKVRAPGKPARTTPLVLGWDAAGVVDAVGQDVSLFKPGDQVFYAGDITRPGSNSQYQLVDERIVGRRPRSVTAEEAAALPLVSITAYEALFERLGIDIQGRSGGHSLLVIGGAGGVGSMAIQLAKIARLTVFATASRSDSTAWVKQLGADHVLDHRQSLPPQLEAAGRKTVDYILNCADTDRYWDVMADVIAPQGKICTIVENAGPLNQQVMKLKSVTHVWELMFTRSKYQTPDMIEQHKLLNRINDWIDGGTLKGIRRETLTPINAENLRKAHAKLESGTMIGKLVVKGW
ncbi:MAG TPA: zinc-binding alcohol dehydrogenase family protein [Nitrospira sp.]|nr:zinc-binding alcohol dehydrogenase family protein [Nitrospira sp.]